MEGWGEPAEAWARDGPGGSGRPLIGSRCATELAGGLASGAPRPARLDAAVSWGCAAEPEDAAAPAADAGEVAWWVAAVCPASVEVASGAPSPAGGIADVEAAGDSAQRLTVRTGPVPRGAGVVWPLPDGDDPGAVYAAAPGRPEALEAADAVAADPLERWATATGAGDWVMGLAAGVTVAPGATAARCRIGPAVLEAADGPPVDGLPASIAARSASIGASAQAVASSPWVAAPAAWCWAGRVGMGAREVRLGTVETCATTRPGGADGPVS